ncbi:MAG: PadR family transcriptional regulator [Thermoanaerobaculia bacterium]
MSLPHLLLGLLSRASASGWDLRARLSEDPALGWDATLAQIYPALERLRRGGFVSVRKRRSPKGPPRLEYRVTLTGLRELRTWLAEPPVHRREHDPAVARLAFLEMRPPAERVTLLRALRDLASEALRSALPGTSAARRRRRALLETELAWADAEAAVILSRHPRTPE